MMNKTNEIYENIMNLVVDVFENSFEDNDEVKAKIEKILSKVEAVDTASITLTTENSSPVVLTVNSTSCENKLYNSDYTVIYTEFESLATYIKGYNYK